MGIFYTVAKIGRLDRPGQKEAVKFLVDTGAFYTVVARDLLAHLGVKATRKETVQFADGRKVLWDVGEVRLTMDGHSTATWVLFGKPGTQALLGAYTLEGLGLTVDPRRKRLAHLPVVIVASLAH